MKATIEVGCWSDGAWHWEVRGTLMDGDEAYAVRARCGVMKPTREEALSAARRVAKQLNLEVEE